MHIFNPLVAWFCAAAAVTKPRGVVIFLVDDNGYADLGAMGYEQPSETPHLDALAASGVRFTDFHALPLCTPSRAQLLTGRLGPRTDLKGNFDVSSEFGLNLSEILLPEFLSRAGFYNGMVGKWHLGHNAPYHPTFRGFDAYVGLPGSVDMGCIDPIPWFTPDTGADLPYILPCNPPLWRTIPQNVSRPLGLSLMNSTRNCGRAVPGSAPSAPTLCSRTIVEQPADLTALSDAYNAEAARFLAAAAASGKPFFLYFAFSHTHAPLAYNERWRNASLHKTVFWDTMREVDNSIGAVVGALKALGLYEDTFFFSLADNGPPISQCGWEGHMGPFSGDYQQAINPGGSSGKGTTWEGGHRVWATASWPAAAPAGRVSASLTSSLDIFPTIASVFNLPLPADRVYDGVDLSPLLLGADPNAAVREWLFLPDCVSPQPNVTALRWGNLSIYLQTNTQDGCRVNFPAPPVTYHDPPLAFDLSVDTAQATPVALSAAQLATVKASLAALEQSVASTFRTQINWATNRNAWPCCNPAKADCRC